MCGIAGIIGNRVTEGEARLARMSAALVHRGPDDDGVAVWPDKGRTPFTGFVHRRLSIIDLSAAGHQPMSTPDGRFSIIYNGEIYNYRELRRELQTEGASFASHTDTEVILQLYARRGVDCLRWLRGMFAFAVRDNQTGEIFIARDHLGIKPLYYFHTNQTFSFASELRALLESGLMPRRLSPAGLTSYLQSGSVASPGTMIEGVALLQAGHYLTVAPRAGGTLEVKEVSYTKDWLAGSSALDGLDRPAAVEALRDALKESVRLHLVSDVPLAPFLSGGIDSSAIVALMSEVSDERPKTFSVVFAEQKFSEAPYARCVAEKFKTDHHEIQLSEQRLYEMLPAALAAIDQPTMDGINTFVVAKAVRDEGITVALSGLGGDELFAGYPTFRRALKMRSLSRMPAPLRRGVAALGARVLSRSMQQRKLWQLLEGDTSPEASCEVSRQLLSFQEIESALADGGHYFSAAEIDLFGETENGSDTINSVSRCELRGYMANTLLRDTDCMSMAHSLEVRVPFVDSEIVRFVLSLPGAWKLNGGRPKPLLQDALGDLLPTEIANRPKMGFTLPFESWMQARLRDEINETFADAHRFESIGFRPGAAREIWQRFLRSPRSVGWSRPWALYVLAHWCAQYQVTL
jgi:asparagine synthase (glutamine-hydrolysing)